MTNQALFVDLPNFYSHLLDSKIDEPRLLRDYVLYWLDFDRLAEKLTGNFSSVWIFYSKLFGPRQNRIEGEFLKEYIKRINSQKGVTARNVDIPGKERESATYICDQCGHEGEAQWKSEKGVDASLTVHLFDTMDSWDSAYLLSGDADFMPVVTSLRRRGKIIIGAGFSDASLGLKRECYDYVDLSEVFLNDDVAAFKIFGQNGIKEKWLTDEVKPQEGQGHHPEPVELQVRWSSINRAMYNLKNYFIYFSAKGPIDLSSREQQIEEFKANYSNYVPENYDRELGSPHIKYQLIVSPLGWNGVQRRLRSEYEGGGNKVSFTMKYEYDPNTKKYENVP